MKPNTSHFYPALAIVPIAFAMLTTAMPISAQIESGMGKLTAASPPSGVLRMVKDLNPDWWPSYPRNFTEVNGKLIFTAVGRSHGIELWIGDVPDGDVVEKEIMPGSDSSNPFYVTKINDRLIFWANDSVHGYEPWSTDGTLAGTSLVKDINPGAATSDLKQWIVFNGQLFFSARTTATGLELWRSDGTTAGTVPVMDINPGLNGSSPDNFVVVNNQLIFTAQDKVQGRELWRTDGTEEGTRSLKDIGPGLSHSNYRFLGVAGNRLFFAANDVIHGEELWASDGTEAGTFLLKDIALGDTPSGPFSLTNHSGVLFFYANDTVRNIGHGTELWKSDGTAEGTVMVKDITPDRDGTYFWFSGSQPSQAAVVNGRVLFTAQDHGVSINSVYGQELWITDGTDSGTSLLKDIGPGSWSSSIRFLCTENNRLIFLADDYVHGKELWSTDGTPAGTILLRDINLGEESSDIITITNASGWLFFTAFDPLHMRSLWKSDGTESGTLLLKSTMVFPTTPINPIYHDSRLYFVGGFSSTGNELCVTDGTEAGTYVVGDVGPGYLSGVTDGNMLSLGRAIYFAGNDNTQNDGMHGEEPWMYQPAFQPALTQIWLRNSRHVGGGRVQFDIESTAKGKVLIQRSSDLQNWTTVDQVTVTDPSEHVLWSEIFPAGSPGTFYRGAQ
jgi:ELWxxDGT repeat protein